MGEGIGQIGAAIADDLKMQLARVPGKGRDRGACQRHLIQPALVRCVHRLVCGQRLKVTLYLPLGRRACLGRKELFKQSHDNWRCNIIGQICHDFDRSPLIFLFCNLSDIYLQNIFIQHFHIVISGQSFFKDRYQIVIDLHSHDFPGMF